MLNTVLNPGNRVMSKRDRVPMAMGSGERCPLRDRHKRQDVQGHFRPKNNTKKQRHHRELCPLCGLSKGHMRWSRECG